MFVRDSPKVHLFQLLGVPYSYFGIPKFFHAFDRLISIIFYENIFLYYLKINKI